MIATFPFLGLSHILREKLFCVLVVSCNDEKLMPSPMKIRNELRLLNSKSGFSFKKSNPNKYGLKAKNSAAIMKEN